MNNIEEKIKKEFQQREIQPSIIAWDKLADRLDQSESKKKNKLVFMLKIAAVFIGLLVVVSFFINQNKEVKAIDKIKNTLVHSEIKKKYNTPNSDVLEANNDKTTETNQAIVAASKQKQSLKKNESTRKITNISQINLSNKEFQKQIVQSNKKLNSTSKKENHFEVNREEKVNDIAINKNKTYKLSNQAPIKKIKMNSSDDDIDLLLANALKNNEKVQFEIEVKDKQLQYAAEKTLKTSLKYKVYQTIKSGVNSVIVYNKNKNQ